jgi:glycosyltransferase involved in cell wall biosynthesis
VLPHDTGNKHLSAYRSLYETVDRIIVHTNATKQELLSLFTLPEDKVVIIDHGLIQPSFDPDKLKRKESEFEQHYQLGSKVVFSSLGYQYYYKGVDLLAEVWATTPELRQNDKCKLLLVGKNRGVDLRAVEGIDNVIVEDRLTSDEEFIYLMQRTDIYVLPYRTISQSGVLLTAIYTGTPFLVTEVGGLTEPLDIANVGWKLHELSVDSLRSQLLWLLHHPEAVVAAKNNKEGWDKLRQHYDWSRIGILTQHLYEKTQ